MTTPSPRDSAAAAAAASAAAAPSAAAIDWQPWGTEAFGRAHKGKRPVLLSIVARWAAACRVMDEEVFADPTVAALMRDRVVPIRVDADRRPDLADRYGAGGWPTTLLLTADGDPICGGTYVEPARLLSTIAEVADRVAGDPDGLRALALAARRARRATSVPMPAGDPLADITGSLRQSYDPAHSGFGQEGRGKFAWAAPVALALHAGHRSGDLDLITMATATLDRMGWGGLSDDEAGAAAGAFHRATAQADWSEPDRAHLVEVQADMLRLYLDAWAITGDDRYRDRARAVWNYVDRVLHDRANGGFFVSELDGEVHRILLTDANAKMIRALLHASLAFEEVALAETAIRAAERLIPAVYERAGGVAHVLVDTRAQIQGLLGDQIHTVAALLDLADHTGDRVYFDLGDELLRGSLRKLWTAVPLIPPTGAVSGADPVPATEARARGGAFVDRLRSSAGAGDVGLLGEPLRPFALNVEAARLLDRLGRETGHADFIARAADLHIWLASEYRQHDLLAADYGLLLLAASP